MAESISSSPTPQDPFDFELPTGIQPPLAEHPESFIIYGLPKCGKTTEIVKLPNHLVIDAERGSRHIACNRAMPPEGLGPVAMFRWLDTVHDKIMAAERPYDYVIVETVSFLDELSEWVGTWNYMNSIQGKEFNKYPQFDENRRPHPLAGQRIKFGDPDYQSVHDMGKGYGYRWSRQVMTDFFRKFKNLGRKCTIFTCHTVEKQVVSKITNTEVNGLDLSLTGKVKLLFSRDVDCIGYVYNRDGELHISFKGDEKQVGGMRGATHLRGYQGVLDWNFIFNHQQA